MKCVWLPVIVRKIRPLLVRDPQSVGAGATYAGNGQSYHTTQGCHPRSHISGQHLQHSLQISNKVPPLDSIV